MSGFERVAEGPLATSRLHLYHQHTRPRTETHARVLFLGGSNFDLTLKRSHLSSPLVERFEMATYEPRGIGRTGCPEGAWTMADYASDAVACLDALGWDKAHVVGESFGGMTALHLALLAPDRVDRIAIASATAGGDCGSSFDISVFLDRPRRRAAADAMVLQDIRWVDAKTNDPDRYHEALTARQRFVDAYAPSIASGGYPRLLEARRTHDVSGDLHRIAAPTLVCIGQRDRQAPPEAQSRMASRIRKGRQLTFDAGHGLLFTVPKAMVSVTEHLWAGS